MKPRFLSAFLALFTCIISCKKNPDQSGGQTDPPGKVTGTIVLPAGSTINTSTLSVVAPYKVAAVKDNRFDLGDSSINYTPTFVTDPGGKLILAGYTADQATDKEINVTSTAVMLLMNTDLVRSISDSGKKALIPQFKKNKDFPALVAEINKLVLAGKNILDTTNLELVSRLDAVIQTASTAKLSRKHMPVNFTREGRVLNFYSDDNIFHTVIGVYKDGQYTGKFPVNGHQVFPGSISDVMNGIGMVYTGRSTESESYTLQGDGKFDIKMRTGLGEDDGSAEYASADRINAFSLTAYLLNIFVPTVDRKYISCAENSTLFTKETFAMVKAGDAAGLRSKINSKEFADGVKNCIIVDPLQEVSFKVIQSNYFTFVDKSILFKATMSTANICFYAVQWNRANPFFDTCLIARGNNIFKCNLQYDGFSDGGSSVTYLELEAANGLPANPSGIRSSLYLGYAYLLFKNDNLTAEFEAGMNFVNTPGYSSRKFASNVAKKIDFDGQSLHIEFDNGAFTGTVAGNDIVGTFTVNWLHPDFKTKLPKGYPPVYVSIPLTLHLHPDK
ncbi:hypothetical protein [Chitinophaga arvensicola]|uniref:Uncharacterized protein n=1 Tax=Chitinophaga arvensicola TaxID=29529 RepID=A0A1I0S720_9BACT|nr:hypothetical protein [Chitinophaga arvensicola]SEW51526.1 hypothetical protein SAMN04488122_4285 [Chitinophaga arvensicola]